MRGTLEVEIVKGEVQLVATRMDGAESRFVLEKDFSDMIGRKLIRAAKTVEQMEKEKPLH